MHVMVDAGHGGKDSGALSPRGFKEKDFNLIQAL
ncbi:MAG: N-acetylmuramoyl-L-alanine amidase [Kiritimatiellae bacterium]|nr:N-acetylmuramoyl-L-alanine amidase [Kiritimatiellia bacterium]